MIIALDHLFGVLVLIPRMLCDIARSPTLIVLNLAVGVIAFFIDYLTSRLARRKNWFVWVVGLAVVLATVWFSYFPQYPAGTYYKETEIPEGEFAHMVLLVMFPLVPLLLLAAYMAGGIRRTPELPR